MNAGSVALVGAGCGGVDWLTVRAQRLLQTCDTVVYDALIDLAMLDVVPQSAEKIPVGKRAGRCSAAQEDINSLLVELAAQGKRVVRLKGGDPYVFGRGGEEALALLEAGVPYEVVPGISSALAIPLEAGIPVTHRGVSRSFHVITAHTREDVLPEKLDKLAELEGTLVFLMGLSRVQTVAQQLMQAGKDPQTPAAVLSGGNTAHPARVVGTLATIADLAQGVQPPAVFLVGQTAAMDLRDLAHQPLSGVTVGLTGTMPFQAKLQAPLAALGAQVYPVQRGQCCPLQVVIPWEKLTQQETWLVFTSARGVEVFFQRVTEQNLDYRHFARCRFGVIGSQTAQVLAEHGFVADLCPEEFTSAALAQALSQAVQPEQAVWLFQSTGGSPAVQKALGQQCRAFLLYETVFAPCMDTPAPDYLLFGSGGAVKALFASGYTLGKNTTPVCIGPVTAKAVAQCCPGVSYLQAPQATTAALVDTVLADREK
jgi:uroporphyrinogen III methyltransferase/synthase